MARPDQVDIPALSDLCTPWCIHVVATLRIADHIAAGITQIDDLAAASGAHSDSLQRVLRHLVSRGVFEEPAPGRFALNKPAGELIVVLNGVSPDDGGGPSPALLMMVLVGGRDRSLAEFRELAGAAGLEVQAAARQPSGRFVVECRPTS